MERTLARQDAALHIAANVRAEVARRRISQRTIGDRLGFDQRKVSRRLLGHVEWSATELLALADLLDVDPVALLATSEPVPATGT